MLDFLRGISVYFLYCATFKNGKKYIGITSNFKKRKRDHLYLAHIGEGFAFHAAIRKYGSENITWEVLASTDSRDEISRLEIEYIERFDTYGTHGYNSGLGGDIGGKWSYKIAISEVLRLGIKTRSEWEKKSPNSYGWAFKNLVARDIARETGIRYTNRYWSEQELYTEIKLKRIHGRANWFKKSQNSYTYASKHNLIGVVAKNLKWNERNSWTIELMYEDIYSKKYTNLEDWRERGRFSYAYARRNGLVKSVEKEMEWTPYRKEAWTIDELIESTKPYCSLAEWRARSSKAYAYAKKYKLTKEISGARGWLQKKLWSFDECVKFIGDHNIRSATEFARKCPGGYDFAQRRNLLLVIYEAVGIEVRQKSNKLQPGTRPECP